MFTEQKRGVLWAQIILSQDQIKSLLKTSPDSQEVNSNQSLTTQTSIYKRQSFKKISTSSQPVVSDLQKWMKYFETCSQHGICDALWWQTLLQYSAFEGFRRFATELVRNLSYTPKSYWQNISTTNASTKTNKKNSAPKSIRYFKPCKDLKGLVLSKGSLQEQSEQNDKTVKCQNGKIAK